MDLARHVIPTLGIWQGHIGFRPFADDPIHLNYLHHPHPSLIADVEDAHIPRKRYSSEAEVIGSVHMR
jgi:hypothetical protein